MSTLSPFYFVAGAGIVRPRAVHRGTACTQKSPVILCEVHALVYACKLWVLPRLHHVPVASHVSTAPKFPLKDGKNLLRLAL